MLHRRTADPASRAADIADREAERVWQETGDYDRWSDYWTRTYRQALLEFAGTVQ